ncbi:MAG: hypothetical protein K6C30_05170 [Bacteroidaceae bacterium]|nr:hypothetical protein [Bacteroidaceae bacterium]
MIIVNRFLPLRGFSALNICGLILVRRGSPFTSADLRHERIHTRQQRELLFLPFFLLYSLEWLFRLLQTGHPFRSSSLLRAYLSISFEREAYSHQHDPRYLSRRPPFAWRHYFRDGDNQNRRPSGAHS